MPHLLHCPECGNSKYVSDPEQIYCSQPCAKAAQRKARLGNDYREWKRAVIEAAGHACQMCGTPEGKIIAHHIVGLSEAPELKLEPSNGMALCVVCHDIIHDTTGKSANMLGGYMRELKRGRSA